MALMLVGMMSSAFAQTQPERARAIASLTTAETGPINANNGSRSAAAVRPTDVYRIGNGDVIRIDLRDVPGVPKLVRVDHDGTIDFPLAGADIIVSGKTLGEVELMISRSLKLVENARVKVNVLDYNSHTITVWGLVSQPGDQQIQRDAVPFFVIRAMTGIDPRADRVRITRASSAATTEYLLNSNVLDAELIYPGDSIEFANGPNAGK